MQALHVAFITGCHGDQAALIGLDAASRAHRFVEQAQLRRLGANAHLLDLVGAELELVRGCGFLVSSTGKDGDVVHAHRVFLWHRRGVGQAHRVAVVERLLRRRAGRRCVGRCRDRTAVASPIAAARSQRHGDEADGQCSALFHKSSPSNRSISTMRSCASTCALIWLCRAPRICRCASSSVAKSALPFS